MNHAESDESKELLELLKGLETLPSLPPYARDWVDSGQVLEPISEGMERNLPMSRFDRILAAASKPPAGLGMTRIQVTRVSCYSMRGLRGPAYNRHDRSELHTVAMKSYHSVFKVPYFLFATILCLAATSRSISPNTSSRCSSFSGTS